MNNLRYVGLLALGIVASIPNAAVPPFLVVMENTADAHLPDGTIVNLPAGTEIPICVPASKRTVMTYDLSTFAMIYHHPCQLFADGFESAP